MVLGKKRWKLQEYSSFFPWPWLLNHRAGHTKTNTFFPRYILSFPIRIILETFRFPRTKLSLEIYLLHLHTGSLQHFDPNDRHNTSLRKSHIDRFSLIHARTTCLPPFCFRNCLEYELKHKKILPNGLDISRQVRNLKIKFNFLKNELRKKRTKTRKRESKHAGKLMTTTMTKPEQSEI